jgi:hypothetical protein
MRVIFNRKGFDSAAGKAPSPIIDGEPISLPIPTGRRSETIYCLAGLGQMVEEIIKGRIGADDLCHEDPVFSNGCWASYKGLRAPTSGFSRSVCREPDRVRHLAPVRDPAFKIVHGLCRARGDHVKTDRLELLRHISPLQGLTQSKLQNKVPGIHFRRRSARLAQMDCASLRQLQVLAVRRR